MKKLLTFAAIFSLPFLMGAGTVVKTIGGNVATKTASYVITTTDGISYVKASGSGTIITLPAPGSNIGRQITVERSDASNSQCIGFNSNSDTVDGTQYQPSGTSSFCLTTDKDRVTFVAFAANAWQISSSRRMPTLQVLTSSSGTYTAPAGAAYLRVRMVGGGGGGAGAGTAAVAGSDGSATTFGVDLLSCSGGGGGQGPSTGFGGASGVGTISAPAYGVVYRGGVGQSILRALTTEANQRGGAGGSSMFGSSIDTYTSRAGLYGSGGVGGYSTSTAAIAGAGGGAGGGVDAIIPRPEATYPYAVGSGGAGGSATLTNGGAGGNGIIYVEEHYQ